MSASKVGKTLGNFRILECLGSGGAGMIWKAEDLSLGRTVALKALRPELAADGDMAERFRAEARTLAKLSHANIASLYSLIEDDDGLFLVLEYVPGNTLAALLASSGALPFDSAFALFHQVLDGVGHAHEAGIVHRDLKPANLMVDARGRVKVMDFGIARMAGAARTTHHGKLVGTPEYMSPEQVRGEDATLRSDIYSLGLVLFEMVTGETPFKASASFEMMRAQLESAPPDPRTLRPELDARVADAILRALAKVPTDRFASTRELQDVLLEAGASRRGRSLDPVWSALPSAADLSEAPTLLSGAPPGAADPAPANPPTEPLGALPAAITASLDADIETALASEAEARARALAPTTSVIDTSLDTAVLEPARPTRMLEDAPFAAHAQALVRNGSARLRSAWIWAAAALLLALTLGVVTLRESAAPADASVAPAAPASPAADDARPHEASRAAAEPRVERAPAVPAPEPASAPAPEPRPRETKPTSPARRAEKPNPAPEAAPNEEESGWVIRR
jgi:serine/threonine-protein kinase